MADDVIADSGDGLGVKFATDDDGTRHWPYSKLAWGPNDTYTIVNTGAAAVPIQDGGNSITVDGTVTANLSATDNGVLDTINIAVEATQAAVEGTLTVTGVVDLGANNDVTVTSGDITETNSAAIKTAVELIDNAISGSEMQVDVVAPLPAGTNAIGKLAANDGVDIGDVSVNNTVAVDLGANNDVTVTSGAITETNSTAILADTAAIDTATAAINAKLVTGTVIGDVNLGATDNAVLDAIVVNTGGPSTKVIDSYTTKAVNAAVGANSELIAAPGASKQIWVYGLLLMADVAGSFTLQDDAGAPMSGTMTIAVAGGFQLAPSGNFQMPWIKVTTNQALDIDTLTCTADGIITYAIVSV